MPYKSIYHSNIEPRMTTGILIYGSRPKPSRFNQRGNGIFSKMWDWVKERWTRAKPRLIQYAEQAGQHLLDDVAKPVLEGAVKQGGKELQQIITAPGGRPLDHVIRESLGRIGDSVVENTKGRLKDYGVGQIQPAQELLDQIKSGKGLHKRGRGPAKSTRPSKQSRVGDGLLPPRGHGFQFQSLSDSRMSHDTGTGMIPAGGPRRRITGGGIRIV